MAQNPYDALDDASTQTQNPYDALDNWQPDSKKESAAIGAASNVIPTLGAAVGARLAAGAKGFVAGEILGLGPEDPLADVAGLGLGLVGVIGGASALQDIQDAILPDSVKAKIAQAYQDNPKSFTAGSVGAGLTGFKFAPGQTLEGGADILGGRFGTHAAKVAAQQLGFGAAIGVVDPLVRGEDPTVEGVVSSIIAAGLLGDSRFSAEHGVNAPAAAQQKGAEIAKTLTPEEKAHIASVGKTGLTPADHEILNDAAAGKQNIKVLTPDEEAEFLEKKKATDITQESDEDTNDLLAGLKREEEPSETEGSDSPEVQKLKSAGYNQEAIDAMTPEKLAESVKAVDAEAAKAAAKPKSKFHPDLVKEAADLGMKPEQIEKYRNKADLVSGMTMKRRINELNERAKSTQAEVADAAKGVEAKVEEKVAKAPEAAAAEPAKPAAEEPAPAGPTAEADAKGEELYKKLEEAGNSTEMMAVLDSPEFQSLPDEHKAGITEAVAPRLKGFNAQERILAEQAKIQAKVDDGTNLFSEERDPVEIDHARIANAVAGGNVAMASPLTGQIYIIPRGLSRRTGNMRRLGYSENYIRNNIHSLIAHEQIHNAIPRGFGKEYWNALSGPERFLHTQLFPTGRMRNGVPKSEEEMGQEAFRMRMQDVMGMQIDDLHNAAGTRRLMLDTIYGLQKGIRIIRENLFQRGVRGRAVAMIREVELKLGLAEGIANAKAAGAFFSEERDSANKLIDETQHAADEYRDDGDRQTYYELNDRAQWMRQREQEKTELQKLYGGDEKFAAKVDSIQSQPKPSDENIRVTISPHMAVINGKGVGGYVQVDDVTGGKNTWSASPRLLRYLGYGIPDDDALMSLGGGQMTLAQAKSQLGAFASEERPMQDKFSFLSDFDPKPPAPLTPEQEAKAAHISQLNERLNELLKKRVKTREDHAEMDFLEQQLGQQMFFSEERPSEFDFQDPRKEKTERRGAPSGQREKWVTDPQKSLMLGSDQFVPAPAAGELARQKEIEDRTQMEQYGDFSRASQLAEEGTETMRPHRVQESVEKASEKVINDKLARAIGGKSANLDTSIRALATRLRKQYGIQAGQVKELIASAFFKRVATLKGAEIDALLNSEVKGASVGKQFVSAESAGRAEQSREISQKEKGIHFSGTPDEVHEAGEPEEPQEHELPEAEDMTVKMLQKALGGKFDSATLDRFIEERKAAADAAAAATVAREKESRAAKRAEFERKLKAGEHIHIEEPAKVKEPLREAPEATVKHQDDQMVRAAQDLKNKRLHRLFIAIMKPLLRETRFEREHITPDDLRLGGSKDADSIETFQDSDQTNINKLERMLLSGSFRSSSDPKTASQRLAVLTNKRTGRTYMVSVYGRDGTAMVVDPMHPKREHTDLSSLLGQYRVQHSLLLDEPVHNFKEAFNSYKEFHDKFLNEAVRMNEHAKSNYSREPLSDREAIELAPFGIRINGKKRDAFGHEADINDPNAEKKIMEQRKLTLDQKIKRLHEIEDSRREHEQVEGSNAESIALREQIENLKEQNPEFRDEFEGFHTQVKGTKSWYGPFANAGDIAADLVGSAVKTKGPLTRNESGALFDYLTRKGDLDEEGLFKKIKEQPTSPVVINAIGKFGRTVYRDFYLRTKERQRELIADGDKETAKLLDPRLRGDTFIREIARRLARGLARYPEREGFSNTMTSLVNRAGEDRPVPEAPSKTSRELTYEPPQRRLTALEKAQGKTLPKLAFSSNRVAPKVNPEARTPEIPEATTQKAEAPGTIPTNEEAVQALTLNQESGYTLTPEDLQYLSDSWDKTHDENGEPIKPPPAETAVPKGFDYWKWLDQHNQLSGDIQRLEGEGGSYYSEERFEKAADIAYGLADFVRAQFARRGTKDTLARGVDFASNAAANQSASSGHAINYKSDDMKIKTAANPFIAAKAVRRTFVYSDKAKDRANELMSTVYKAQTDLVKTMKSGDLNGTMRQLDFLDPAVAKASGKPVTAPTPENEILNGLKAALNNGHIPSSQLQIIGLRYGNMVRSLIERRLIDEGEIDFKGVKYSIDDDMKYKLGTFRAKVNKAIVESTEHMKSNDRSIHRMGRDRLKAAKDLLEEINTADGGWENEKVRNVAIEISKQLDTAFASEKAAGYDARYDDSFMPGRYDAEFFNNDGVSFGNKRVLGLSFGAKTFPNYYDAIAAGPYIAMTRDPAAMVEHRVRQGMTKLNMKAWEEGWKGMNDEHTGAPIAVGVKKSGDKDVPDPPRGVVGARYEIVKKADGSSMAVLYGYHRLYNQLTKPSEVMDSALGKAALYTHQFLKHTVLAGDFFHFSRVGFYSAAISGTEAMKSYGYKAGWALLELKESQLPDAVRVGQITQAQADWAKERVAFNNGGNPGAISRIQLAYELQRHGLNVGQIQDALYRDLASHMPILGELNKKWSRFLFDKWTRGLMARNAVIEFERITKLNPDKDSNEILKGVARDMNNFFGSIGRQGWIRSRTWQDVSRMCLLAPQWFEGIVKKDFAIPYKLMTGVKNGQALEMLKGQETAGRGIARGLLFMAAATQILSLIANRRPTWENDDKNHMFDVQMPNGIYLSPLSVYNEIMHDLIRYGETRPKVWDAIQQIGENKLGFYGRAAMVLATDKKGSGEYITSSAGVAAEVAKQFIPAPITLKGPIATAIDVIKGRPITGQDVKSFAAISGLKLEVGQSVNQQMQSSANKFLKDNHLQNPSFMLTPTDEPSYSNMRHAIEQGDVKGAEDIYRQLRQTKTRSQIFKSMMQWKNGEFTGSAKNEMKWKHSLDETGRAQYRQAIQYKRDLFNEWKAMYNSIRD